MLTIKQESQIINQEYQRRQEFEYEYDPKLQRLLIIEYGIDF